MLISVKEDFSSPSMPFASRWTYNQFDIFSFRLMFAHPSHPNFVFEDKKFSSFKQGETVDKQKRVYHSKFTPDFPLVNCDSQDVFMNPVCINSESVISTRAFQTCRICPENHDMILATNLASYRIPKGKMRYEEYTNGAIGIYWNGSITAPAYKIAHWTISRQYWNSGSPYGDPVTRINGKIVTSGLPSPRYTIKKSKDSWIVALHDLPTSDDGLPISGDYSVLDHIRWIYVPHRNNESGRYQYEEPFSPVIDRQFERRVDDLVGSFDSLSMNDLLKSTNGMNQAIYDACNGVQFFNIMGLMFIHDTVGLIKDLSSFKKNPTKTFAKLQKTSVWKNWANTFLSIKYGMMTEIDDLKHISSKLSQKPQVDKRKSFGTIFDNNVLLPNTSSISNKYTCLLRYREKSHKLESPLAVIRKAGLAPDLNVIWEAIPFSFVADWVTNIGDNVTAADAAAYGVNSDVSVAAFRNFTRNQLGIEFSSIVLSIRSEGMYKSHWGLIPFTYYHRIPFAEMPRLKVSYDFNLHTGFLDHKSELSALILQRAPR